jgi:hypothetical protein
MTRNNERSRAMGEMKDPEGTITKQMNGHDYYPAKFEHF